MKYTSLDTSYSRQKRRSLVWICVFFFVLSVFLLLIFATRDSGSSASKSVLIETSNNSSNLFSKHCQKPYQGKLLLQYVIIIDAGSQGSRIHIYKFNYCQHSPELEDEIFEHLSPGLSFYGNDPEAAAKSLDPLLDVAVASIPASLHSRTPLAVKATAGLRLLGPSKSSHILSAVRSRLGSRYPFDLVPENGVSIMDGSEEGVFAWITVNYLLGAFSGDPKKGTSGVLDLGGGSIQLVFEPVLPSSSVPPQMPQGDHRYTLSFAGKEYVLYQHSYLGYGLVEARKQINQLLLESFKTLKTTSKKTHPCFPLNYTQVVQLDGEAEKVVIYGSSTHKKCRELVQKVLKKEEVCAITCGLAGVYQPRVADLKKDQNFYAFSFFFDQIGPLVGGAERITIKKLRQFTEAVCTGNRSKFVGNVEALKMIETSPDYCLNLSYIYGLLSFGLGFPDEREIQLVKKINGIETGWCLGAAFALL